MQRPNGTLMRAQEPPFEQRGDAMYTREEFVRDLPRALDVTDLVAVAGARQAAVPLPSVGVNGPAVVDRFLDEAQKTRSGGVGYRAQPDAADALAILFSRHDNQGLRVRFSPADALLISAHVGLVDFHQPVELVSAWANHGASQLMQHRPDC